MNAPLFSIVIPSYNRAHLILRALESAYRQGCQDNFEVIVVDDGSTDHTREILQSYIERGVRYFRHDANLGVGPARNRGTREACGEWIIFLDTDNVLLPHALHCFQAVLQQDMPDIGVYYARCCDFQGANISGTEHAGRYNYHQYLLHPMKEYLPLFRREILLQFPFRETPGVRRECGGFTVLKILKSGWDFYYIPEIVLQYDSHSAGRLSHRGYILRNAREMLDCNRCIIHHFGADILRINRKYYLQLLQKTVLYCILCGQLRMAGHYMRKSILL